MTVSWRDHAVRIAADCRKLDPAQGPVQTVLGVSPFLGDAAKATDLSDLFEHLP